MCFGARECLAPHKSCWGNYGPNVERPFRHCLEDWASPNSCQMGRFPKVPEELWSGQSTHRLQLMNNHGFKWFHLDIKLKTMEKLNHPLSSSQRWNRNLNICTQQRTWFSFTIREQLSCQIILLFLSWLPNSPYFC